MAVYNSIIVDLFNLYFRAESFKNNSINTKKLNDAIDFVENTLVTQLDREDPNAKIYFLIDPLPISLVGLNKTFKNIEINIQSSNFRKEVNSSYKLNRDKNPETIKNIMLLKNYFEKRDPKFCLVYDNKLEADDFVEPLIKYIRNQNKDSKILLVTSDSDWSRYIEDQVVVSTGTKEILDKNKFKATYGFYPTIASITLMKAFFGDVSDGISGALIDIPRKYKAFSLSCNEKVESWIYNISEKNESLNDVLKRLNNYKSYNYLQQADKNDPEIIFFKYLLLSDATYEVNLLDSLLKNIEIIRSRCKNIENCLHTYTEKENAFCNLIEATLQRGKFEPSFMSSFGKS
jgi:hypothetical protein